MTTETTLADLKTYLAQRPGAVIEEVAKERQIAPRAVLEALPAGMVKFAPGEAFATVMEEISGWGEVTLIVHTEDAIFEFTGSVPPGELSRGYFNLMQPKGLHGHLRHDNCAAIAFVERPFMGKATAFIAFLNQHGGIMFKVFVGRNETKELRADQLAQFRALAASLEAKQAA